jgi:hypothetical protein
MVVQRRARAVLDQVDRFRRHRVPEAIEQDLPLAGRAAPILEPVLATGVQGRVRTKPVVLGFYRNFMPKSIE